MVEEKVMTGEAAVSSDKFAGAIALDGTQTVEVQEDKKEKRSISDA